MVECKQMQGGFTLNDFEFLNNPIELDEISNKETIPDQRHASRTATKEASNQIREE
jgi:hypothetical protein